MLQRLQRSYRALIGADQQPLSPPVAPPSAAAPIEPLAARTPVESPSRPPLFEPPVLKEGQIDVRDLIARYDATEHAALADAYFAPLLNDLVLRRKPFINPREMVQIMTAFTQIVDALRLYPQVRILDFGAGTAWTSRFLASIGCQVTAIDVSKNALQIGKSIHQDDPLTRNLPIEYRIFDGRSIAAADKSFDRILSFDAFHHVADQQAVLREFSRVLTDDGLAGFAEPGPFHSLSATSQMEMINHNVIENDIRVEEIWHLAQACGFADIKLSFTMPHQTLVSLDDFNRFLDERSAPDDVVFTDLNSGTHFNRRNFILCKSVISEADSRFVFGLSYRMDLREVAPVGPDTIRLALAVENTGGATWLPSGYDPGNVNVGIHLKAPDGVLINHDFARLSISAERVRPGQTVEISGTLPHPGTDDFVLELDLVAEGITWFELVGGNPTKLAFSGRAYIGVR